MQRKTWMVIGAGVLVVAGIGALTGGEDSDKEKKDTAKPTVSTPAKPADKPTPEALKPSSGIPSPDPAQTAKLIAALRAVDPGLVAKETRAVSRARDVCADLKQHKGESTVRKNARARYEGGTVPTLTDDQAAQIVTAVQASFCD
ncbi:DUF732 domain-containing protein [Streptomyces netropsis]